MDEDNVVNEEFEDESNQGSAGFDADKLQETLQSAETTIQNSVGALQLLQDQDVQKLIQLKNSGVKVEIKQAGEDESQEQEVGDLFNLEDEELETYDNKQLLKASLSQTAKLVDAAIKKSLTPIVETLEQIRESSKEQELKRISEEVAAARKKFPDFDSFKPQMLELHNKAPMLSVEELYYLAKRRSGSPEGNPNSEKPTVEASSARRRRKKYEPGRSGLSQILADATERLDVSDLE